MIPVGEAYRPAGTLDARSILITTILGTTAAVLGAALVWLWEWSPIPTLVIVTPLAQGAGVGAVMAFAVGRLGIRNPRVVATVGFACGLLSVVLVHYGHYLHLVTVVTTELRTAIAQDKTIPEAERQAKLQALDSDPAGFIDPFLKLKTGHSGFLGSLLLRNEQGVRLRSSVVTGTFLWILWGAEALIAAVMASVIPAGRAAEPFCEDCGYWCAKEPDLFVLPAASTGPLVEAIREDNPARVTALRANPPPDNGLGLAGVTLLACPGCDQSFADVSHRFVKGKETKITNLLKQHRVSTEMAAAMRSPPPSEMAAGQAPVEKDQEGSS
jgi:hypothetical protein